jgi:2-dehydropantoate 2-reductase
LRSGDAKRNFVNFVSFCLIRLETEDNQKTEGFLDFHMPMRILIVGAGAVGGYFGGRLAQAGRDVTFLVRPSRAKQLGRDGLRIISPHGDAVLTPKLISAGEIDTPYDLVFLSVKAYALEAAMNDFAAAIGPETMIFPALNGMRHIDLLTKRFGEHAVIGGVCLVASEIDDEGRIVQLADFQQLVYGERNGVMTPRLQTLHATLQGAGFEARLSTDIMQEMWEKWVQLASLGAITCLMRGAIGEIVAVPGGADLSLKVLDESAAVAIACGHQPSEALLSRHADAMTAPGSQLTSSMYRDLRKGAPVEVDHILGDIIERGGAHRVATPLLKAAFINLRVYQERLPKH